MTDIQSSGVWALEEGFVRNVKMDSIDGQGAQNSVGLDAGLLYRINSQDYQALTHPFRFMGGNR